MAGDVAQARQTLFDMQDRVIRDPYDAFGVTQTSTAAEIRRAFLEVTKTFHPAKFGRAAVDIQKLANEVFLTIRAAYDTMTRTAAKAASRQTGSIPLAPSGVATPSTRPSTPPSTRPGTPPGLRPSTPNPSRTTGSGVTFQRSTSNDATQPMRPLAEASQPMRPITSTRPSTPPPTGPSRVPAASPAPVISPRDPRRPTHDVGHPATPATGRSAGSTPPQPTQPMRAIGTDLGGDPTLSPILALLDRDQYAAARAALHVLATRAPTVQRYHALIAYANGREAQLASQINEARIELSRALQLDPDLQLAKTALGELFSRRK